MKMTQETLAGDTTRIALEGRLDIEGTQAIDMQFSLATTSRTGRYAVDLSAVSFVASIGIRLLYTAARGQLLRGGKLVIVMPPGMGLDVLKTAGVDLVVPIVGDMNAAQAALGDPA